MIQKGFWVTIGLLIRLERNLKVDELKNSPRQRKLVRSKPSRVEKAPILGLKVAAVERCQKRRYTALI